MQRVCTLAPPPLPCCTSIAQLVHSCLPGELQVVLVLLNSFEALHAHDANAIKQG
jgi:hypothetical protein